MYVWWDRFIKYISLLPISEYGGYIVMEKRSAESYQKKMQYSMEYAKQKYKRVPLDVTLEKYEEIKRASETAGETVNGYIKKAIDMRMDSEK